MIDKKFKELVATGDQDDIRINLKNTILIDSTLTEFDEKLQFATGKIPNLIEEHDGETFKNKDEWTEKYLYDVLADLTFNFSQERIDFLHQLAPAVLKVEKTVNKKNTKSPKSPSSRRNGEKENGRDTKKIVGAGTAVVGAIATATGLITAHTVLTIGGACVTIAGVAIAVVDNSKE